MIAGLSGSTLVGAPGGSPRLEGLRPRKHGRTQRGSRAVFTRDHHHQLEVGQTGQGSFEIRHVVLTGEAIRCDERPRPALAEDVSHLFGSVDMDDRNEDHPEGKQSIETGDRFSPIRKLEGYDVSGGDAGRTRAPARRRPISATPPMVPTKGRSGSGPGT